jgi:hypothetical protein
MPIKIGPAQVKEFVLSKSDEIFENEGEPSRVSIRLALKGEDDTRNHMFSLIVKEQNYDDDFIRFSSPISTDDIRRKEVFLVLADCNLADQNDNPIFVFDNKRISMTEREFDLAFGMLPLSIANEIIDCVLRTNLQWIELG